MIAAAGVSAAVILLVYWRFMSLQRELANCQRDNSALREELVRSEVSVERLRSALNLQNEEVDRLESISELRQQRVQDVRRDLSESRRAESLAVRKLEDLTGKSCMDGIALIDQEIGI